MSAMVTEPAIPSEVQHHRRQCHFLSIMANTRTVGEHVGHHGDFVVHGCARPQELVNLMGDRAPAPPLHDRVKQQFATTYKLRGQNSPSNASEEHEQGVP